MRETRDLQADGHVLQAVLAAVDPFLGDGVFQCNEAHTLLFANGPFMQMFGFSTPEDVRVASCDSLFADDESMVFLMDQFRAGRVVIRHRILCKRKDGSNFWASVSGTTERRGSFIRYTGVITDITYTVKVEEDLRHREVQLAKLTMELDRFMYSASHEIRSPVSTLMGIINLMKHDLKEDQATQYIRMLVAGVDRLDQVVGQLTVHVKNSKNRIDDKRIDFDAMIRGILNELQQTHSAFAAVCSSLVLNSSAIFYCDPDRLRLILYNVIKNAYDYADRRKSNRLLNISVVSAPEKAIVEIFDNGIGIASRHVARVFEMFYRATNVTKGSGIGLYTVREMVTKMGGIITLHSEFGIGTSVRIELPNSKTGRLINRKRLLRSAKN